MAGCAQCGQILPAGARFCPACGTPAGSAASAEVIKLVTILFADVVGSTAQAEQMPPEETRALMADFFDAMSEEILAEGGTIERLIGDALMADFGVPIAHEDDPARAVRAGLRMLARLETWNESKPPEQQIQIRIGINTGAVSTGGSFGEQLMVMGDEVNVAARLQQAAEPDTIVVGEGTARAIRGSFRLHPLESISAKGKTRPLPAFVVESELDRPEHPMLRAPLVGRTDEMTALREAFDLAAREPAAQFVLVVGDAGVGKSRLIEEFVASLTNVKTLFGRCLPYGDGVTLSPLQEILRSEAGIVPQDEPGVTLKKVQELVGDVLGESPSSELEAVSAALTSTLGSSAALGALADLDPRLVYSEMARGWRTFLTALAHKRPLLVIIEDIYWADPTMLDVLSDLSEHLEGPISFILAARPDLLTARADWLAGLRHSMLRVEPLEEHTSGDLAAELLGGANIPSDFMQTVLERAEGNPLFIEEILLRLVDEGYLREERGTWRVAGDLADVEIPELVQTLIQARLDLLSPREREVLRAGAVVGRNFWLGAVEEVTGFTDIREITDRLKPSQMISERLSSAIPGETEYAFRHLLIRDVVYESLPRKVRAEAHAAVARWIETIRGTRIEEAAELLADHYERAYEGLADEELRVRSRSYYMVAAQSALRRFAIDQAERFGRRAVDLSLAGAEKVEALETLGDAFYLALRGNPAWDAYAAAFTELEGMSTPGEDLTFARLAAKASIVPTRWIGTMDEEVAADDIDRLIEAGLRSAGKNDGRERAMLLSARAFLAGTAERHGEDAEAAAREAVAMAQRLDDPDLVSAAMDALAVLLWPTGRFGEISRVDRARLDLIPDISDVREIADILLSAGRDLGKVGDFREALGYLDRAADTVREIDIGQYLHVLVQRSQVRFMLSDWDGAIADLNDIERFETTAKERIPPFAGRAYGVGFFCHHLRGEAAADRYLQMLCQYREDIAGAWSEASGPFAVPARALALRGQFDEALDWLSLDVSGFIRGEHLQGLCDVIALAEDWERAREVLQVARAEAAGAEMPVLGYFADRLEGCIEAGRGNVEDAIAHLDRSVEGFASLHASWEEAWSRLLLAESFAEARRRGEAEHHVSRALPIFDRLASTAEIERARALLG